MDPLVPKNFAGWFHENLLMANATKISRHAVYKVEIEAPRRSSDSTDSIDARFSQRHAFASSSVIRFSKIREVAVDSRRKITNFNSSAAFVKSLGRSVERKGIEPLTPGLQSRCSPS